MLCPSCGSENDDKAEACCSCGATLPTVRPGSVVASRYEILQLLGKGGMGMVFKARDRELDEVVALKVLRTDVAVTPELAGRFRAEIKMARRVTHKNVCRIHEYGQDGDLRYISMAFVEGVDLKHILRQEGALPPNEAYEVAIAVAEGLHAIHEEGIIHRDLKTPNIMRDHRGIVRLMDFGIAKQVEAGPSHGFTVTGMIVGTPEYMSPEQCKGQKIDFRSDIYALGVVVFELFTGHTPFRGDTSIAIIIKHLQEPPPLDGPEAASIPSGALAVLRTALAKDPDKRYATALEMAEALREARAELSTTPALGTRRSRSAVLAKEEGSPEPTPVPTQVPTGVRTHVPTASTIVPPLATQAPTGPEAQSSRLATPRHHQTPPSDPTMLETARREQPQPVDKGRTRKWVPATVVSACVVVAGLPLAYFFLTRSSNVASPTTTLPLSTTARSMSEAQKAPGGKNTRWEGGLQLVVIPWADVTIDGAPVETGKTRKFSLSAGAHTVRLVHPDYQPLQRKVTIKPGETLSLTVDLPEEAIRKRN